MSFEAPHSSMNGDAPHQTSTRPCHRLRFGRLSTLEDEAIDEFRAYKIRLEGGQLSRAEQDKGLEWCLQHKAGIDAKFE